MSPAARRYFGCVLPAVLAVGMAVAIGMIAYSSRVVFEIQTVEDGAMTPWLEPGASALVFNTTIWATEPTRGMLASMETPDGRTFRRVVAVPGDIVEVKDGRVLVDGRPSEPARRPEGTGPDYGPLELGPDEFFVLADVRTYPDSREWGPLPREVIFGQPQGIQTGDGWLPVDEGVDQAWFEAELQRRDAEREADEERPRNRQDRGG